MNSSKIEAIPRRLKAEKGGIKVKKSKRRPLEIINDSPSQFADKRLFCRFGMSCAGVRFKDLKIGERGKGACSDIGGGGLGAEFPLELKQKTPLELWIDLPDKMEPLHILGKVVWSKPSGNSWRSGISFDRPKLLSLGRVMRLT